MEQINCMCVYTNKHLSRPNSSTAIRRSNSIQIARGGNTQFVPVPKQFITPPKNTY